jgi:hypothetical protein
LSFPYGDFVKHFQFVLIMFFSSRITTSLEELEEQLKHDWFL